MTALFVLAGLCAFSLVGRAPSVARTLIFTYLGLVLIPVLPAFQALNRSQLIATLGIAVLGYSSCLRIAYNRGTPVGVGWWAAAVPILLSLASVGLIHADPVRLAMGVLTGLLIGVSVLAGKIATDAERRTILVALTVFAQLLALIALVEAYRGVPVYDFTPFQTSENARVVFRASALLGHPVVLSTVLISVAAANMARPRAAFPWVVRTRILCVGLPLVGAAATVSRSAGVMILVATLAVASAQRPARGTGTGRGFPMFVLAVSALFVWTALLDPNSAFGQRLSELSISEQSVRISGFDVVRHITTGIEVIVGGGTGAVRAEFASGSSVTTFGTVDNQFWTAYADFGLIGVFGLILLVAVVLLGIRRRGLTPWQHSAVIGGVVPVAAMLFFEPLSWPAVAMLFGYAAGSCRATTLSVYVRSSGIRQLPPESIIATTM